MRRSALRLRAFTLVEIMVVITIVAVVLVAITRGYRNRDRSTKLLQCRANLVAIANAMESFKQNQGEYIHSKEYKFYSTKAGGDATQDSVTVSLGGGSGKYYATEEDVDIAKLIELGDKSVCKCFADLPVQCPADPEERSASATSYHVVCNPFNFTVYCTCGEYHYLTSGFPRYIHGVNTMDSDGGQVTVKAGLENAEGQTE